MSRNFLSMNDELQKGDFLLSNNRKYRAVFQVELKQKIMETPLHFVRYLKKKNFRKISILLLFCDLEVSRLCFRRMGTLWCTVVVLCGHPTLVALQTPIGWSCRKTATWSFTRPVNPCGPPTPTARASRGAGWRCVMMALWWWRMMGLWCGNPPSKIKSNEVVLSCPEVEKFSELHFCQ